MNIPPEDFKRADEEADRIHQMLVRGRCDPHEIANIVGWIRTLVRANLRLTREVKTLREQK